MAKLSDALNERLASLQQHRARTLGNHAKELAEIDGQIAALQAGKNAVTKDIEDTYDTLLAMGLILPVNR